MTDIVNAPTLQVLVNLQNELDQTKNELTVMNARLNLIINAIDEAWADFVDLDLNEDQNRRIEKLAEEVFLIAGHKKDTN